MAAVPQQVVSYVVDRMREGYDAQSIRNYLLQTGYDARTVDGALDYVYKRQFQASGRPRLRMFGGLAAVMVVLLVGATFFF